MDNVLINLVAANNAVLNQVLATCRVPSETKRALNAQRVENRQALNKLAKQHNLCPGCFQRSPAEGHGLCLECKVGF